MKKVKLTKQEQEPIIDQLETQLAAAEADIRKKGGCRV